ncbi:MAG: peptide chain release factor N(5)-glutamine methyltransferase, partial [Bdellovibrionales bacterium]
SGRAVTDEESKLIAYFIDRRAAREPVNRILGEREFWGLAFGLNEATLEPRPDSETVVESVLKRLPDKKAILRMLDLGTGTGCLLLALLHEYPHASGLGVDIAPRAVEQARRNARRHGLSARAEFRVNNWADGIGEIFDLVVSNPPYIRHAEIAGLMPEVRDHDPHNALDGGEDGYEAYRLLIPRVAGLLKPGGLAVFEVGEGQAAEVCAMFRDAGYTGVATRNDLAGVERAVIAYIP